MPRPAAAIPGWQGWIPWVVVSAVVIAWTHFKVFTIGQQTIAWPGLHNAVAITLYGSKPYAANWVFQPLATGTAILVSADHRRQPSSVSARPGSSTASASPGARAASPS